MADKFYTLVNCGCKAKVWVDDNQVDIEYCLKHQSANDMLEVLKAILNIDNPPSGQPGHVDFFIAIEIARKLINHVEGKNNA